MQIIDTTDGKTMHTLAGHKLGNLMVIQKRKKEEKEAKEETRTRQKEDKRVK